MCMRLPLISLPLPPVYPLPGEPGSVPPSGRLVDAEELVLGPGVHSYRRACRLQRSSRPVGRNDCGMVVGLMTLKTPECPQVGGGG